MESGHHRREEGKDRALDSFWAEDRDESKEWHGANLRDDDADGAVGEEEWNVRDPHLDVGPGVGSRVRGVGRGRSGRFMPYLV